MKDQRHGAPGASAPAAPASRAAPGASRAPAAVASAGVVAAIAWLVPGGGYLMLRRYRQFALFLVVVSAATVAGALLGGGNRWPASGEQGLDGLAALMARGGALAKAMAGGPYLLARLLGYSQGYLAGCLHEYGTALLTVAGLLNLLALADAWEMRRLGGRA
ncbi:MAG: DUF6677 family protein [Bryobacteraceae bacterium]